MPLAGNFLEEISNFLEAISIVFPILLFFFFFLFLCIVHLESLSHLSVLFFGTLYSDGYIFPFLLCLLLLFFSQLFVRPPQTAILPFYISSFGDGFDHSLLYNVTILCP